MNYNNVYRVRIFQDSDDLCLYERLSDGTTRLHSMASMDLVRQLIVANQEILRLRDLRDEFVKEQEELVAECNQYERGLRDALKATTDTKLGEIMRKALGE